MVNKILRYFFVVITNAAFLYLGVALGLLLLLGVVQVLMDIVFPWQPGDLRVVNVFTQVNFWDKFRNLWVTLGTLLSFIPMWSPESYWLMVLEKFKSHE